MDRGWYLRFTFLVACLVVAWFALWPSLSPWIGTPAWVSKAFPGKISPGLDIRGGLRMMYEVEVDEALTDRRDRLVSELEEKLGRSLGVVRSEGTATSDELARARQKVRVRPQGDHQLRVEFTNESDSSKLDRALINNIGDVREVSRQGKNVVLETTNAKSDDLVQRAVEVISNRIDELAIRETSVQARETDIVVEIPGADRASFDRIREIIARTARLEFRIVEPATFLEGTTCDGVTVREEGESMGEGRTTTSQYLVATGEGAREKVQACIDKLKQEGKVPEDRELLLGELEDQAPQQGNQQTARRNAGWRTYLLQVRADVTGDYIQDAFVGNEPTSGKPVVLLRFDGTGAEKWDEVTGANVKRRVAIILDNRVKTAPVINQRISGGSTQITLGGNGDFRQLQQEAKDLVVVLRAGALPVPIRPANEQLIGPTLGRDSIQQGAIGALAGILLVLVFMALYYEVAGIVADIAVAFNLLFLLALLALLEGTLTLPGIAGMALTVGMSVDANVLINERIREELRAGKSPRAAVDQGFGRAFWTVFDSHVTTFTAGVVLFQYGTGPIKGFAVTLMLGIVTALFTGVFCSRVMMDWVVRGLRVQRLRVG